MTVGGASGGRSQRRIHAKFFFRKLMSPLVDESWELMDESSCSSGSIFLASCFPSSTLPWKREVNEASLLRAQRDWSETHPH